jgi:hypothetical protein
VHGAAKERPQVFVGWVDRLGRGVVLVSHQVPSRRRGAGARCAGSVHG